MAWAKHGFSNTDILFGHAKARLDKVSVEDWLMLLMRIMIMEYNQLLFPGRFRLQWGMREALTALGLGLGLGLGLALSLSLSLTLSLTCCWARVPASRSYAIGR